MPTDPSTETTKVSITPLLKRLWHESADTATADEIALAISRIFSNSLSEVQTGALLTALHFTDRDRQADVLTKCAEAMRNAAVEVDAETLGSIVHQRGRKEGGYAGGLVRYALVSQTSGPIHA